MTAGEGKGVGVGFGEDLRAPEGGNGYGDWVGGGGFGAGVEVWVVGPVKRVGAAEVERDVEFVGTFWRVDYVEGSWGIVGWGGGGGERRDEDWR